MAFHSFLTKHVAEEIFDAAGEEPLPLPDHLRISAHLFFCSRCSGEVKKLESLHEIMTSDFFPVSPDFGKTVMEKINSGEEVPAYSVSSLSREKRGFSTKSWIVTGCFMFLSLATVFFGMDFGALADTHGSSFLLPVGLTIGLIVTGYGALFVGSHLNELSDRLRRH